MSMIGKTLFLNPTYNYKFEIFLKVAIVYINTKKRTSDDM